MSMNLILWKAPVVREEDDAKRLLDAFYEREDVSAFEPSSGIRRVTDELEKKYPYDASGDPLSDDPWGEPPSNYGNRLLLLDIRWGSDDAVLDDIERLAREHDLVLYDPQGPSVHLPTDPPYQPEEVGELSFGAYMLAVGVALGGVLLVAVGWTLSVPVLNWLLIIGGLFIFGVGLTLSYAFFIVPAQMRREAEAKAAAQGDS